MESRHMAALVAATASGSLVPKPAKQAVCKPFQTPGYAIPRNSRCPCGSGRKAKHCHGKNGFIRRRTAA